MEENKKLAEENNNVLTQMLNDKGELVNVKKLIMMQFQMKRKSIIDIKKNGGAVKAAEMFNLKQELFEKANHELKNEKDERLIFIKIIY